MSPIWIENFCRERKMIRKRQIKSISQIRTALFFLLILWLVSGCGSPYKAVRLNPIKLFEAKGQNAVNSSNPSLETRQYLRLMFLDKPYDKNPQEVIGGLVQKVRNEPSPEVQKVLAELTLIEARKVKRRDPQKAVFFLLMAAQYAYDYLFSEQSSIASNPLDPSYRFMADIYDLAIAQVIEMKGVANIWKPRDVKYEGVEYHYEIINEGYGIWDPQVFDYLHSSYEVSVTGLANQYATKGLGAPLVGIVEKPGQKANFGRFYPPKVSSYPVSAVLLFEPMQKTDAGLERTIKLVLYDSLQVESVQIQGRAVSLEADFTTPLGLLLRNVKPLELGLRNLINSDIEVQKAGIYMLEPYRPDKIPVVLVHGLMSSPATWAAMFNDLRGDPELRKHYQFWFFMYPTGLPIMYSASILRNQLNEVHSLYDPNGTNPNFNHMVLVGHSMGGLLSRLMVQDSKTIYWDNFFKKPFDVIDLDPNSKQMLKDIAFFERLPYVKRVIFIATPHRGSPTADAWYTRFFSGFVNLPNAVSSTADTVLIRRDLIKPEASKLTKKTWNSLLLLSPSSGFMKTTQTVPLCPDIPYHSIIGTRIRAASGAGTSDGVVPYESSHLDFTQSEKLVPSGHGAHAHPLAIDEVKRILRLHLAGVAAGESQPK
jgi:pimeloyl-ACP methyl ester carboxylesterase